MTHVFVSYVHEDERIVRALVEVLKECDIKVWIDREDIAPGTFWEDAIRRAIENGAFFLACFSKSYYSKQRSYMNEELAIALKELRLRRRDGAWFIPVHLDDTDVSDASTLLDPTLRTIQFVSLHGEGWDDGVRRIAKAIHPLRIASEGNPGSPRPSDLFLPGAVLTADTEVTLNPAQPSRPISTVRPIDEVASNLRTLKRRLPVCVTLIILPATLDLAWPTNTGSIPQIVATASLLLTGFAVLKLIAICSAIRWLSTYGRRYGQSAATRHLAMGKSPTDHWHIFSHFGGNFFPFGLKEHLLRELEYLLDDSLAASIRARVPYRVIVGLLRWCRRLVFNFAGLAPLIAATGVVAATLLWWHGELAPRSLTVVATPLLLADLLCFAMLVEFVLGNMLLRSYSNYFHMLRQTPLSGGSESVIGLQIYLAIAIITYLTLTGSIYVVTLLSPGFEDPAHASTLMPLDSLGYAVLFPTRLFVAAATAPLSKAFMALYVLNISALVISFAVWRSTNSGRSARLGA